jgi:hypothetical protein
MIRFTRTGTIAAGHFADGAAFAAKATEAVNKLYPDAGIRWGVQVGGPVTTVHWTFDVPDLATVERMMTGLLTNSDYISLVDSAGAVFVPGTGQDTIVSLM